MFSRFLASTLLMAALAMLAGCWRHAEVATQREGTAYLKFLGSTDDIVLVLDEGDRIPLSEAARGEDNLWEVLPGRHLVRLYKGEECVVRRDVYAGPGQVLEITVPR